MPMLKHVLIANYRFKQVSAVLSGNMDMLVNLATYRMLACIGSKYCGCTHICFSTIDQVEVMRVSHRSVLTVRTCTNK